jgi:(2Fe-2S) ferredoxin
VAFEDWGTYLLEELRHGIWQFHLGLPRNSLVTWISGNVSGLDRETGYVVIKPSGVRYEELKPEQMVIFVSAELKGGGHVPGTVLELRVIQCSCIRKLSAKIANPKNREE